MSEELKVKINVGAFVGQDHCFGEWPVIDKHHDYTDKVDTIFTAEENSNGQLVLTADGFGVLDKDNKYGNGKIYVFRGMDELTEAKEHVSDIEDLESCPSCGEYPDETIQLIELYGLIQEMRCCPFCGLCTPKESWNTRHSNENASKLIHCTACGDTYYDSGFSVGCPQCRITRLKDQLKDAVDAVMMLTVETCDCGIKSPELEYHKERCRYRIAQQTLNQISAKGG